MIPPIPTRTLRDYLASLPAGPSAGVVGNNLVIRTDLATSAQGVPAGGTIGMTLTKLSNADFDTGWVGSGSGDMLKSVYDPQNINADAFDRANQTGTQSYTTITGLDSATLTWTNKRITPRVTSVASTATLTPNADTQDGVGVTAQAAGLTIAAPTGTPTDGQRLIIRVKDNGTSRAITWNAIYTAFYPQDLRTATVITKPFLYEFIYNSTETQWQLLHSNASYGLMIP